MCGITGIISRDKSLDIKNLIIKANQRISHRGPNGDGIYIDEHFGFGHNRLSVIDLTEDSKQPIISNCKRYLLSFNGMIYNFKELANEIHASDKIKKSDTLVLLEYISKFGIEKTLESIDGMFAIAVYDFNKKKISLARDRFGKKPLYFFNKAKNFIFASELKSILSIEKSISINQLAVNDYFKIGFCHGQETFYEGIMQVEPGSLVTKYIDDVSYKISYFDKSYEQFEDVYNNFNSEINLEYLEKLIDDSVRMRLRSDVKTGIFLSGGVDSGLITAFASKHSENPINTYTVVFDDQKYSEKNDAFEVARRYKTNHTEINLDSKDLIKQLDNVYRVFDEPISDPSIIPSLAISNQAKKHCKVILNGEGADEIFGGYRRLLALKYAKNINFIKLFLPKFLYKKRFQQKIHRSKLYFLNRFIEGFLEEDILKKYEKLTAGYNFDSEKLDKLNLSNNHFLKKILASNLNEIDKFRYLDLNLGMSSCLLKKVDMTSMHNGLEVRCPFLDKRLTNYLLKVPAEILLKNYKNKYFLKKIARKYLPKRNIFKSKQGFEIPVDKWVYGELYDHIHDSILSNNTTIRNFFKKDYLESILSKKNKSHENAKRLWALLLFRKWEIK